MMISYRGSADWVKSVEAVLFSVLLALSIGTAHAARDGNVATVGILYFGDMASVTPYHHAFVQGLKGLGYVEGQSIKFVTRYANGNENAIASIVNELIRLPVDVLVVSSKSLRTALDATTSIPIVCPAMADPVREGLVASFARPGGNLTGGYGLGTETDAKRFELLREVLPRLTRVGVLLDSSDSGLLADAQVLQVQANKVGVTATIYGFREGNELKDVLRRILADRLQALVIFHSPLTLAHKEQIMGATAHRLPTITEQREFVEAGALVSYAASYPGMYARAAWYVDKILKGARAGDLPIEQPTKFDLFVNLQTAKALGIRIPESVLERADEVFR